VKPGTKIFLVGHSFECSTFEETATPTHPRDPDRPALDPVTTRIVVRPGHG
jgi:hypothetical protein